MAICSPDMAICLPDMGICLPFVRQIDQIIPQIWRFAYHPQIIWYLASIILCGVLVKESMEGRFNILLIILRSLNIIYLAVCFQWKRRRRDVTNRFYWV
ncbi:hypothetical protein J3E68DRAFT_413511 [Trichoderma sp. SZMC 28012]